LPDEKCYNASHDVPPERSGVTSDNAYPGALFSASQIASILHLTPARVRQLAQIHHVGRRVGYNDKYLLFTFDDLMLFVEVRQQKMRNKIRRLEKHALVPTEEDEDPYPKQFRDLLEHMMNQVMLMIHECSVGMLNRLTKVQDGNRAKFFEIEQRIKNLETRNK